MEATRGIVASVTEVLSNPASAPLNMPARMRAHYSPDGIDIVRDISSRYRFVMAHVEGYFLFHYLAAIPPIQTVLVAENIEFALEEEANVLGYIGLNPIATRQAEVDAWRKASVCVCVTPEDAEIVRQHVGTVPVRCVTDGVDHLLAASDRRPLRPRSGRTCLYAANYQWLPSRDAAIHLLRDIWPDICQRVPESRLILAGSGLNGALAEEAKKTTGVSIHGEYRCFEDIAAEADLFVFPMRFGGGIKVKVIEAISVGLPTVTTMNALRGFPAEILEHVWIANSRHALYETTCRALEDIDCGVTRAQRAKAILQALMPTWRDVASDLARIWQEYASRSYSVGAK
ncbi:MAG TPA: glycosyltransferase [Bryobacteraceae bacterium]|jgi:glycosyltransferase involved in cell wall biosynthesis|nr:glycosyltransferase [Bryobacteraceae bacterium]